MCNVAGFGQCSRVVHSLMTMSCDSYRCSPFKICSETPSFALFLAMLLSSHAPQASATPTRPLLPLHFAHTCVECPSIGAVFPVNGRLQRHTSFLRTYPSITLIPYRLKQIIKATRRNNCRASALLPLSLSTSTTNRISCVFSHLENKGACKDGR